MVSKKKKSGSGKNNLSANNSCACVFCKQISSDELNFGGLKATKNVQAHYYCLLFSETIKQSGQDNQGILGFMAMDILNELRQCKRKQCCYCKEFGANLGCLHTNCNQKFHLSCGLANKIQLNFNNFTSLCHNHRKITNIPVYIKRALNEYNCVICFETFNKNDNISDLIWASCCKSDIVFHICCIKELTLNAGYFTKCPGCNNKNEFVRSIKSLGVFVPERDASWELENNAFSELLYVHNTCDVEKCTCPKGRNYTMAKGQWKIIRCKLCGSFGTHVECSTFKREFVCDVCKMETNSVSTNASTTSNISAATLLTPAVDGSNSLISFEEITATNNAAILEDHSVSFTAVSNSQSSGSCFENQETAINKDCNAKEILQYDLQMSSALDNSTLLYSVPAVLPSFKRKLDDLETTEQHMWSQGHNKIMKNNDSEIFSVKSDNLNKTLGNENMLPKDNSDNLYEEQRINISSSARLNNLIDFVEKHEIENVKDENCTKNDQHTHIHDLNKDISSIFNGRNEEQDLISKNPNSPTYKISLDINSEIEFVSCPDLNKTTQTLSVLPDKNETSNTHTNMLLNNGSSCSKITQKNKQEKFPDNLNKKNINLKVTSGIHENRIQDKQNFSDIRMQKRYIPRYWKGRRITKINFGNPTAYYARIPFRGTSASYKWNFKFVQRRSVNY